MDSISIVKHLIGKVFTGRLEVSPNIQMFEWALRNLYLPKFHVRVAEIVVYLCLSLVLPIHQEIMQNYWDLGAGVGYLNLVL